MKHCSQMFLNVLIYKHSWQLLKPTRVGGINLFIGVNHDLH